ncbi:MAG TPA: cytochrome c oxidase subunit 3 [Myxococcales bacterium]|nr:cytochrome c oxidase subunit 3 [Myxococcales bacterium]
MSGADVAVPGRPVRDRDEATARLGMLILFGALAMMYAALLFAYSVLRFRLPVWPPEGAPGLPVRLAGCNAALLALSGGTLQRALASARLGRHRQLAAELAATALLGLLFVAGQAVILGRMWRGGLRPEGGTFPAIVYALTGFHALQVVVGLLALSWLLAAGQGFLLAPARQLSLRLWTSYWQFVCAAWLVLCLAVFVL